MAALYMQEQAIFLRSAHFREAEKGGRSWRAIGDKEGLLSKVEEIPESLSLTLDSPPSRFSLKGKLYV